MKPPTRVSASTANTGISSLSDPLTGQKRGSDVLRAGNIVQDIEQGSATKRKKTRTLRTASDLVGTSHPIPLTNAIHLD